MSDAVKCSHCGKNAGRVNKVTIAWPDGTVRGGWLHRECEPALLAVLESERRGGS